LIKVGLIFTLLAGVVCSISLIGIQYVAAWKNDVTSNLIVQVQYTAFSGVPFPNCLETVDDKTVILHWIDSCSSEPFFENLKYYSDLGYHVQSTSGNVATNGESVTTLVNLGYRSTYEDVMRELLAKEGIVCPSYISC
jgi:hypothetical protein